jgi:hypothetical protein
LRRDDALPTTTASDNNYSKLKEVKKKMADVNIPHQQRSHSKIGYE